MKTALETFEISGHYHDNTMSQLRYRSVRVVLSITALFLAGRACPVAVAQNYLTSTGQPSFSAPEPVELGTVDASSGNLHLSIPLGSYAQRGGSQSEPVTLEYDSNIWNIQVIGGTSTWDPDNGPAFYNLGGWHLSYQIETGELPGVSQNCLNDIYWMDRNGTTHAFHLTTNSQSGCPSEADAFATDSSGYHMYFWNTYPNQSPVKVYAPDGTLVYSIPATQDPQGDNIVNEDTNGNYLSLNSNWTNLYDTLDREISSEFITIGGSSYATISTSQGTSQYSFATTMINVNTDFQQTGVDETATSLPVIRSLTLPDAAHSTYYFTYDCNESSGNAACGSPSGQSAYYGELISVTLSTGGTTTYAYTTFSDAYSNKTRWLSSREAANGSWTYTPQVLTTCSQTQVGCQQQTTVQTPTGTTIYTFTLNNGAWPVTVVRDALNGQTLSTVSNTWDFSQPCVLIGCHGASYVRLIATKTTVPTTSGNLTKQTTYSYDSPQKGNQTAIEEWRYITGGSFPSVPDRATYISYLYTGTNNNNRPTGITLCNNAGSDSACPGGGTRVSQTLITYDSYGASGLTSITGITHHDDTNFGAAYTTRGNPTSVMKWVTGSTYLTTSYTYDTTGQILTATDPAANVTHYSYADNFYTDGGNNTTPSTYTPANPTNAYMTSIQDAVGSQALGYYFGSGHQALGTDYNGVSTYVHFQDGMDRQTEEVDPIGWKLSTYSSATQSDMYTAVADTSPSAGCSSCQHTQTLLDTWGRTASQILINDPIGQVNVDSTYDPTGQMLSQSHPYAGKSDPNYVFETYGYDALGRQLSTTHPDGEVQQAAFGADVLPLGGVTSQQGSTSTYGYGYPGISEDEAGHQRQEWSDGFGRTIEVDEPSASTASFATATVAISSGPGQQEQQFNPCQQYGQNCPQTAWNSGDVYLTVDGYTASAYYGQGESGYSTAASVASALGAVFDGDPNSPVTAAVSGSSIVLTAKGPGAGGNVAFSSSGTYSSGSCPPYNPCFTGPAFSASPSSGDLSGGSGGIASSPLYTNYTYDAADHLTQVVQGVQSRTFQYDGLGRKIYEDTPEAGIVTYAYTASGGGLCSGDPSNVCQRTDARGVVSTYTYDHANRLTGVAYTIPGGKNIAAMPNVCTTTPNSTSANVCSYYDQGGAGAHALGRLTEMVDPTGSETYVYDADGRETQLSKIISGKTYSIGYQYDTGGDVTQITYPSGRVVAQAYNVIGQVCLIAPAASGCSASSYYASGFSYNGPGNVLGFTYGNGVVASFGYSAPRTQLTSLAYTQGSTTDFSLQYWYQENSPNCPNGASQNNGSIQCISDGVNSGRSVSYGYDPLSRLISAKTAGSSGYPQWGLSEAYDRFGNRWTQTVTAGSGPASNLSFGSSGMNSSTTNQPNTYSYDASGNMVVEPFTPANDYAFDGENRMTGFSGSAGTVSYSYDGNGMQVVRAVSGGTTTVIIRSGSEDIAEYDNGAAPTSPSREYVYNPAGLGATTGLLAMISGGATTYYHQDHLSVRLVTNSSGAILTQEGHFPFGEPWYQSGGTNNWYFTSYDRDSESGLDYALARYYDSRTGTFCSADPLAGSPDDPQSWNRYAYGRNDPIDITDPTGKNWFFSLIADALFALAPFTGGATLPYAEGFEELNGFSNLMMGQPPWGFGSFGGLVGSSGGGVWNDQWGVPNAGIAGAFGLPTIADVGGPIENAVPNNYSETIRCGSSASQVMAAVESNFPRFGNYSRGMGSESVAFSPPANMGPGSTIPIKVGIFGYTEDLSVNVQSMNSQSMTFTTNPGHLIYPGSITFAALPASPGYINFNIHTSGTVAQPFRYKHGGSAFEDAQWNHFLGQVSAFCNGNAQ